MRPPRQRDKCYRSLVRLLRGCPPGSPGPSEDALAQVAQVARRTARSALQQATANRLVMHLPHCLRRVTAVAHASDGDGPIAAIVGGPSLAPGAVHHGLNEAMARVLASDGWRSAIIHNLSASDLSVATHGCSALIVLEGGPSPVGTTIATVMVGEDDAPAGCARVLHDHAEGGRRIAQALAADGRTRPLRVLTPRSRPYWLRERDRGIDEGLAGCGVRLVDTIHMPIHDRPEADGVALDALARLAAGHLVEWLRVPGRIDALIGTSDSEMFIYARALRLWGLEPGRDVALAAYDGYWRQAPEQAVEPLTGSIISISKDFPALANAVRDLLRARGEDGWGSRAVLVPPSIG